MPNTISIGASTEHFGGNFIMVEILLTSYIGHADLVCRHVVLTLCGVFKCR